MFALLSSTLLHTFVLLPTYIQTMEMRMKGIHGGMCEAPHHVQKVTSSATCPHTCEAREREREREKETGGERRVEELVEDTEDFFNRFYGPNILL